MFEIGVLKNFAIFTGKHMKYTNGLQLVTFKSELLHRYLLFPFLAGTSISNMFS